jgi:hypothetical protein
MLEAKYGIIGYAFYYKLLQLLASEDGHYYDARDPMSLDFLEQKLCGGQVSVTEMLGTLSKWGKIDQKLWDNKVVWYQGFVDTLIPVYKKRERQIPEKEDVYRKLNIFLEKEEVTGTEMRVSVPETPSNSLLPSQVVAESTQSKVKYSKVEREREERKTPSLEEIKKYCKENGYQTDPDNFFNKHEENGWLDKNGNIISNWKARLDRFEKQDFPNKAIKEKVVECNNHLLPEDLKISRIHFDTYIAPLNIEVDQKNQKAKITCENNFNLEQVKTGTHGCPINDEILREVLKVREVIYGKVA